MVLSKSDTATSKPAPKKASSSHANGGKHHQLNRFLTKTFHMVNNGDPKVMAWAPNGDSFIVEDIEAFSENVLPQYFKHSKFSSFVRQLNFYGFRKIRNDCGPMNQDDGMQSGSVRFYHEYFQKDQPELLHKINRATKAVEPSSDNAQVDSLQGEINRLKTRLETVQAQMEARLTEFRHSMEVDYQRRITNLEKAYRDILVSTLSSAAASSSFPSPLTTQSLLASQLANPLLALSATSGRVSPPHPAPAGQRNKE